METTSRSQIVWVAVRYADDDPAAAGEAVMGLPVLGLGNHIPAIVHERHVDEVIVTMPSTGGQAVGG